MLLQQFLPVHVLSDSHLYVRRRIPSSNSFTILLYSPFVCRAKFVLASSGFRISLPGTIETTAKTSAVPVVFSETAVITPTGVTFRTTVASSTGPSTLGDTAGPSQRASTATGNVGTAASSGRRVCHRMETLVGITLVLIVVLVV